MHMRPIQIPNPAEQNSEATTSLPDVILPDTSHMHRYEDTVREWGPF